MAEPRWVPAPSRAPHLSLEITYLRIFSFSINHLNMSKRFSLIFLFMARISLVYGDTLSKELFHSSDVFSRLRLRLAVGAGI